MWFILEKTTRGYELKAVGFNRNASEYAGMNVKKNIVLSMVISGAFAGLSWCNGSIRNIPKCCNQCPLYQVLDLMELPLPYLGANQPLGVFFGAILFGSLKNGGIKYAKRSWCSKRNRVNCYCINYSSSCIRLCHSTIAKSMR